jgi:hypothetical protein
MTEAETVFKKFFKTNPKRRKYKIGPMNQHMVAQSRSGIPPICLKKVKTDLPDLPIYSTSSAQS